MNIKGQILLVVSNLVLAASVSFHVFRVGFARVPAQSQPQVTAPSLIPATTPVVLDVRPLQMPLEILDQSVNRLTLTIQRFNTTTIQYEYLRTEIERLTRLDQTLTTRFNEAQKAPSKVKSPEFENSLKQLQIVQEQVQVETKRRRESMGQLVDGLERQLEAQTVRQNSVAGDPVNGKILRSAPVTPVTPVTPSNQVKPAN